MTGKDSFMNKGTVQQWWSRWTYALDISGVLTGNVQKLLVELGKKDAPMTFPFADIWESRNLGDMEKVSLRLNIIHHLIEWQSRHEGLTSDF